VTRLALGLIWLLHWLPYRWLAFLGDGLGALLWRFGRERRHVALTNLRLCFPQLSEMQRRQLAQRHFACFARALLARGLLWYASPERLRRLIQIEGLERLHASAGPTLLLVPHFVGLDAGWTRLTLEGPLASVYARQKDRHFDAALLAGRRRFNQPTLLARQNGMRGAVRALRAGLPFYYLPDLDYGARDALFVPFFGVPAATITGLSRLARLTGARVLPVIVLQTDRGYTVRIDPPWTDFPGACVEEDTQRMNDFIEEAVRAQPEQYFWLHKRFKTRPAGEPSPYR